MIILICVGSSCHIKGAPEIIEKLQKAVEQYHLENEVTLAGSFCTGQCNRVGVTIQIDDEVHTGVTPEGFDAFFAQHVLAKLNK